MNRVDVNTVNYNSKIQNILKTSIEIIDLGCTLIKEGKYIESINCFNSLIEGFLAIENYYKKLINLDETIIKTLGEIKIQLEKIVGNFESSSYGHVLEIASLILAPKYHILSQEIPGFDKPTEKKYIIGVYNCEYNPKDFMIEDRIKALIEVATNLNSRLVFFNTSNVNFDRGIILAKEFMNNKWNEVEVEFPDVIQNVHIKEGSKQSLTEKRLRKLIPFTSFTIMNKMFLPFQIIKSGEFGEYFIPFKYIDNYSIVENYFNNFDQVVIKPISSSQGTGILYIEKKKNRFFLKEDKKKYKFNISEFKQVIKKLLDLNKNNTQYIIQPYVKCRTKEGNPYDIRAHLQKNGEGKWVFTKVYPRIGGKDTILSNISKGGETLDIKTFVINEFGKNKGEVLLNSVYDLAMKLTTHVDSLYNMSIDELGIDIAIDENNRLWVHEVQPQPQSKYHEKERAQNMLEYALFLAENEIFLTNEIQESF